VTEFKPDTKELSLKDYVKIIGPQQIKEVNQAEVLENGDIVVHMQVPTFKK